jgi:cephalosporin hydroxylase
MRAFLSRSLHRYFSFLPPITKLIVRRRLEDAAPSFLFHLNAARRRQAQRELHACKTIEEYLAFTQRHLGTGSIQRVREIEGALWFLQEKLKDKAPLHVCEIGTEYGGTNLLLGHALPNVELLIGVDLWVKHAPQLHAFKPKNQELHLVNGSSYAHKTVEGVAELLNGRLLEVLFIDGDHRYEGVKNDFLLYRQFVCEGGFILLHDIVPDDKARFGRETTSWAGGVPLLWHRLKAFYSHHEWVQEPQQDGLGIGALRYDPSIELPDEFINSHDDDTIYSTLTFEKTV